VKRAVLFAPLAELFQIAAPLPAAGLQFAPVPLVAQPPDALVRVYVVAALAEEAESMLRAVSVRSAPRRWRERCWREEGDFVFMAGFLVWGLLFVC